MSRHLRSDLVFRLSCWLLALVAFGQLLTAGVALAVRVERAQEVRIVEKEGPTRIITVAPEPAPPTVAEIPVAPKVELPPLPQDTTPLPPPRPLAVPAIADPVVERLVAEARKARVADDMATAMNKVEAALDVAPKDPNVLYEKALVYEEMAAAGGDSTLADQAAEAYQQILALGTTGAGSLYSLAGEKLTNGIAMPADLRGEMALGRVRIFKDDDHEEGQRVVVTVPVHGAPKTELEEGDLEVKVTFYDSMMQKGKREIVQTAVGVKKENVSYVTLPFDFATGEELVRFTYILPRDDRQQEHLFGKREYYGQVVELIYKGEVLDAAAWPRHLSTKSSAPAHQQQMEGNPWDQMPEFLTEDMINPAAPLLPSREGDFLPNLPADLNPGDLPPPPPDR